MHILFRPSYSTIFLVRVHILIPIISLFIFCFLFCLWTRLSTTFDEVIVYPIPALLYLVKNLLQVSCGNHFFIFGSHSSIGILACWRLINVYSSLSCCSTTPFSIWMPQVIKYLKIWILSVLAFWIELYLRRNKSLPSFTLDFFHFIMENVCRSPLTNTMKMEEL